MAASCGPGLESNVGAVCALVKIRPEEPPGGLGPAPGRETWSPVLICQNRGVSSGDTKTLITTAVERLGEEIPALRRLKLVVRLELRSRGDMPVWRIEVPGPKISKDPAADARLDVSVSRPHFNELAADGRLSQWIEAYQLGHVKVTGDSAVIKLLGAVIDRQRART